ncbi:uncharacterized protein DS421_18g617500 [Arachis hypogaea]|nr:uncharacterized protein DS421_18g617500 [Arachis hypogaea]
MSEAKKVIVRELGFGGLMHIPLMKVPHKLLKELANSFNLDKNKLDTSHGSFRIKPKIIGAALGLNTSEDFHPLYSNGVLVANYDKQSISCPPSSNFSDGQHNRVQLEHHVLNFIIKDITNYRLKKKKSIDGCLYALMIVYFHLTKHTNKKGEAIPGLPWVSHWNRKLLVARIKAEIDGHMGIVKKAEVKKKLKKIKEKEKEKKEKTKKKKVSSSESDSSEIELDFTSESESEQDSEEATKKGNNPPGQLKSKKQILEDSTSESESESNDETDIRTEDIEEFLRESKKKKTNEKAAAQRMKEARLPSTEGHYDSSKTMPEINLGSENDPLFQAQTDQSSVNKSTDSMLGLEEESVSDPAQQKMIVVRMETHPQSEPLDIVPIQVCMPPSQTTAASPVQIEPSPPKSSSKKISEETIKDNPPPEAIAALMMIANTAFYVPK